MIPPASAHDGTRGSVLLEREEPLRQLGAWLNEAQAGPGRLVMLGGEAGVGKTVLIQHFCPDLSRAFRVRSGAGDPLSTPRPLGPLVDIAGTVGGALERAVRDEKRRHRVFQSPLTDRYLAEGIAYCAEHDLDRDRLYRPGDFCRRRGERARAAWPAILLKDKPGLSRDVKDFAPPGGSDGARGSETSKAPRPRSFPCRRSGPRPPGRTGPRADPIRTRRGGSRCR